MYRKILGYGIIAGTIVGVPLFALPLLVGNMLHGAAGMAAGYLTMLIALSTVFVAIKRQRDVEQGGVIRFLPALGLGLGITLVASVIYVLVWELVMAVTQMDFIGEYAASTAADMRAAGASEAEVAKAMAEMEAFRADYANPLVRLPMTMMEILPVGVLVSLVSAGLLANRRFLPAARGA